MFTVKITKKIWYKKSIFLILFCLANFHTQSWFNFGFLKNAIQEHEEAYKKFAPERESTDIKVNMTLGKLGEDPVKFSYSPETPHLLAYVAAFKKLENRTMQSSFLKGSVFGLLIGFLYGYRLVNLLGNDAKKELIIALFAGLIFCTGNAIAENKLLGKQPHFDPFLNKWDNYFSNISITTIMRIFVAYTAFFMTGLASTGLYYKMN